MITLENLMADAEQVLADMRSTVTELNDLVEAEQGLKHLVRQAEDALKVEESMVIVGAEMQAQDKEGPLVGIAKTSKAYGAAVDALLDHERKNGGALGKVSKRRSQMLDDLVDAEIERAQAANRFSALKHQGTLIAAMLNALTAGTS